MQRPKQGQVVVGVDTHKEIHVAAAVGWQGTPVGEECLPTTRQGYRQLESWARSLGDVLRVGAGCSGSYGSGLTRHLAKNGFAVLEVTFPDKTVRRKRGKDDFIDAEMAAEAAFTGTRTVTPKSRDRCNARHTQQREAHKRARRLRRNYISHALCRAY